MLRLMHLQLRCQLVVLLDLAQHTVLQLQHSLELCVLGSRPCFAASRISKEIITA